jgi:hypothetical protein
MARFSCFGVLGCIVSVGLCASCGGGGKDGTSSIQACLNCGGSPNGGTDPNAGSPNAGAGGSLDCPVSCDDGFSCTVDSCVVGKCQHSIGPQTGATACPTGQYCTLDKGCTAAPACATVDQCTAAWKDDACKVNIKCEAASSVCTFDLLDKDNDGHAPQVCGGDDCDDSNAAIHPGATETCNGVDDNCNGTVDEDVTMSDAMHECVSGQVQCKAANSCGTDCIDLQTSPAHCGTCTNACGTGFSCVAGVCVCPAGSRCPETVATFGSLVVPGLSASYQPNPLTLTVDTESIYVVVDRRDLQDYHGLETHKVPKAGGAPVFLATSARNGDIGRMAVDGQYVYWGTEGNYSGSVPGAIMRVPTAGGTLETISNADTRPGKLLLNGSTLSWINAENASYAVLRSTILGSGTVSSMRTGLLTGLAGDGAFLYLAEKGVNSTSDPIQIERFPLAGGTPETITTLTTGCPYDIAVDASYVYWVDDCAQTISRAALGGGSMEVVAKQVPTIATGYSRLILDGDMVYFWRRTGVLRRVAVTGGALEQFTSEPVYAVAVDETHVYWINPDQLTVRRAAK